MNPNTFNVNFKLPNPVAPSKKTGPGRYSYMFNDIQQILEPDTFDSNLVMTLSTKTDHFLLNHRFAMNADKPRYSLHCQYKKDNLAMYSTWMMMPGMKGVVQWKASDKFTQEMSAIILRQHDNSLFKALISRSVYEDDDSCTELIVDNQAGVALYYNQSLTDKVSVGLESYFDIFSNKNIHVSVSSMYRDNLRKCIATFTSNYSLYLYYLRTVNKNVSFAAGCTISKLNSPSEMRCSSLIGYEYNLPRTKAHLQSSINMVGTVKTMIREQLTSNSQIALSGEFNPFYDEYKFGLSFIYGTPVDKRYAFTPLGGKQH